MLRSQAFLHLDYLSNPKDLYFVSRFFSRVFSKTGWRKKNTEILNAATAHSHSLKFWNFWNSGRASEV